MLWSNIKWNCALFQTGSDLLPCSTLTWKDSAITLYMPGYKKQRGKLLVGQCVWALDAFRRNSAVELGSWNTWSYFNDWIHLRKFILRLLTLNASILKLVTSSRASRFWGQLKHINCCLCCHTQGGEFSSQEKHRTSKAMCVLTHSAPPSIIFMKTITWDDKNEAFKIHILKKKTSYQGVCGGGELKC